jgi:hypothetical protein
MSFVARPCLRDGSRDASDAVITAKLRVDLRPIDECHQSDFGLECVTHRTGRFGNLARVIANGSNMKGHKVKPCAVALKLIKHPRGQTVAKSRGVLICCCALIHQFRHCHFCTSSADADVGITSSIRTPIDRKSFTRIRVLTPLVAATCSSFSLAENLVITAPTGLAAQSNGPRLMPQFLPAARVCGLAPFVSP